MKYTVFIFLIFLLATSCGESKESTTQAIRPVRYLTIQAGEALDQVSFIGVIKSGREARLSFKVNGVVDKVLVQDGQKVQKGQLIASLDPDDYALQVEQANVQIKQAQTSLNVARSTYQRVERLYESNSVSLSEFEQAKGNYEASQAQLEAARKQEQAAKNQLSYAQLRAPYTGIISGLTLEAGEVVGAGNPVASLSTEGAPEAEVGVADSYVGRFKPGQKVDITLSALPGQRFEGHITELAYSLTNTTTYPVRARIDNPSEQIRPGMSAEVLFTLNNQPADRPEMVIIPAKAVGEDAGGQHFVFVLEGKGDTLTVRQRSVELGALLKAGFEVKAGLEEGEKIATAGLSSLLEGMRVRKLK